MHCQIVLGDVILAQRSDFQQAFGLLLENSSITFLPHVPPEVDYDSVKRPLFVSVQRQLCAHLLQQLWMDPFLCILRIWGIPHQFSNIAQTSFVKVQSLHKCCGVSGSSQQSVQIGLFGHPLLIKLLLRSCGVIVSMQKIYIFALSVLSISVLAVVCCSSCKLHLVSVACSVFPIHCSAPPYFIFNLAAQLNLMYGFPEVCIF